LMTRISIPCSPARADTHDGIAGAICTHNKQLKCMMWILCSNWMCG